MKAVWYERNRPARDVLEFGDVPDPVPGRGEVLVRVHASGVNPSDWKTRSGSRPMVAPRIIPHSDGAGVIEKVGPDVDPSRVGERVWIWTGSGSGRSEPQRRTSLFHQSRLSGFLTAPLLNRAHVLGFRR